MRNIDACLYVRPRDRTTLERLVADGKTPQKIVARARIVLLSGCGFDTNAIQREARGIEADGLPLAESQHGLRHRAPAQGQGQGATRGQEAYQYRSSARDR